MKNFLLIIFTFLAISSKGQAPKNTNTIIVKNVTEDSVINTLINKGYEIKSTFAHNIVTEYKNVDGSVRVKLNIIMKNGDAYIRGRVSDVALSIVLGNKNADDSNSPIVNKGMKGSTLKISWNSMLKVAMAMSSDLEYAIEKN